MSKGGGCKLDLLALVVLYLTISVVLYRTMGARGCHYGSNIMTCQVPNNDNVGYGTMSPGIFGNRVVKYLTMSEAPSSIDPRAHLNSCWSYTFQQVLLL
jgi:hypothetical protein